MVLVGSWGQSAKQGRSRAVRMVETTHRCSPWPKLSLCKPRFPNLWNGDDYTCFPASLSKLIRDDMFKGLWTLWQEIVPITLTCHHQWLFLKHKGTQDFSKNEGDVIHLWIPNFCPLWTVFLVLQLVYIHAVTIQTEMQNIPMFFTKVRWSFIFPVFYCRNEHNTKFTTQTIFKHSSMTLNIFILLFNRCHHLSPKFFSSCKTKTLY